MAYRGQTKLTQVRKVDTGDKDRYGAPIYAFVPVAVWGDLVPLASEEMLINATQITTRFRVMLPASFGAGGQPNPATSIKDPDGLEYRVIGAYETHRLRGAVHHYEALVERVTG